jgi:hypothetical protein
MGFGVIGSASRCCCKVAATWGAGKQNVSQQSPRISAVDTTCVWLLDDYLAHSPHLEGTKRSYAFSPDMPAASCCRQVWASVSCAASLLTLSVTACHCHPGSACATTQCLLLSRPAHIPPSPSAFPATSFGTRSNCCAASAQQTIQNMSTS